MLHVPQLLAEDRDGPLVPSRLRSDGSIQESLGSKEVPRSVSPTPSLSGQNTAVFTTTQPPPAAVTMPNVIRTMPMTVTTRTPGQSAPLGQSSTLGRRSAPVLSMVPSQNALAVEAAVDPLAATVANASPKVLNSHDRWRTASPLQATR